MCTICRIFILKSVSNYDNFNDPFLRLPPVLCSLNKLAHDLIFSLLRSSCFTFARTTNGISALKIIVREKGANIRFMLLTYLNIGNVRQTAYF